MHDLPLLFWDFQHDPSWSLYIRMPSCALPQKGLFKTNMLQQLEKEFKRKYIRQPSHWWRERFKEENLIALNSETFSCIGKSRLSTAWYRSRRFYCSAIMEQQCSQNALGSLANSLFSFSFLLMIRELQNLIVIDYMLNISMTVISSNKNAKTSEQDLITLF